MQGSDTQTRKILSSNSLIEIHKEMFTEFLQLKIQSPLHNNVTFLIAFMFLTRIQPSEC